jgi:hypothetical protein
VIPSAAGAKLLSPARERWESKNYVKPGGRHTMKTKRLQPRRKTTKQVKQQADSKQPQSLVQFFAQSPLAKANLDLDRIPDYGRKIKI